MYVLINTGVKQQIKIAIQNKKQLDAFELINKDSLAFVTIHGYT